MFFFSSRRRHTISLRDWSSDVCSSDLAESHQVDEVRPTAEEARARGAGERGDGGGEIGRASCRERVYTSADVEISLNRCSFYRIVIEGCLKDMGISKI